MTKLFLLGILALLLQACSFVKDAGDQPEVLQNKRPQDVLTLNQKNLLALIRNGSEQQVISQLNEMQAHEFIFKDQDTTPMGLAFTLDRKEVAELLITKAVDPYNLGDQQDEFERTALWVRNKELLKILNHDLAAEKIEHKLTPASEVILNEHRKGVQMVMESLNRHDSKSAIVIRDRLGISCLFLKTQMIQTLQLASVENESEHLSFIKEMKCKKDLGADEVQALYEIELIRQFQRLFSSPNVLAYLSNAPNLKSVLWNIDNSGIYLSPRLLVRIAWSKFNYFRSEGQCPPNIKSNYGRCEFEREYEKDNEFAVDRLIKEAGIKEAAFDLIETRNGEIIKKFPKFMHPVVAPIAEVEDPVYLNTSTFVAGRAYLVGYSAPWAIDSQSESEGWREMTDEYEEAHRDY